ETAIGGLGLRSAYRQGPAEAPPGPLNMSVTQEGLTGQHPIYPPAGSELRAAPWTKRLGGPGVEGGRYPQRPGPSGPVGPFDAPGVIEGEVLSISETATP